MSCVIHKNVDGAGKCVVCGKELCPECVKFQEEYGACPKCLKKQAASIYQASKKGLIYNILSLFCAVAFLAIYIVELCLGNLEQAYLIGGAVIIALLVPISIAMFVFTLLKLKRYKNYLESDKK